MSSLEVVGGVSDPVFLFELRGEKGSIAIEGHFVGGFQGSKLSVRATVPIPAQPDAAKAALTGRRTMSRSSMRGWRRISATAPGLSQISIARCALARFSIRSISPPTRGAA